MTAGGRPTLVEPSLDTLRRARSLAIDLGKSLSGIRHLSGPADPELSAEIVTAQLVLADLVDVTTRWLARVADEREVGL